MLIPLPTLVTLQLAPASHAANLSRCAAQHSSSLTSPSAPRSSTHLESMPIGYHATMKQSRMILPKMMNAFISRRGAEDGSSDNISSRIGHEPGARNARRRRL